MDDWQIERLNKSHDRATFCCGKAPLDDFIHSLVGQYEKRKLGRTYVAVAPSTSRIVGYYTLANSSVPFQSLPAAIAKRLPKHPVPVVLLGRLAVDQTAQGAGLGEFLLMDSLARCRELSEEIGIFAVEVLALDMAAKGFYEKYGFLPLEDNALHLFLPIKTVQELMK
ncbi:MAG: GNAT family N-acetyltransferase [Gemmataceae bacterium]